MSIKPQGISFYSKLLSLASLGAFTTSAVSLPFVATTGPVGAIAALALATGVALAFTAAAKIVTEI